jgi:hypothetical protein
MNNPRRHSSHLQPRFPALRAQDSVLTNQEQGYRDAGIRAEIIVQEISDLQKRYGPLSKAAECVVAHSSRTSLLREPTRGESGNVLACTLWPGTGCPKKSGGSSTRKLAPNGAWSEDWPIVHER